MELPIVLNTEFFVNSVNLGLNSQSNFNNLMIEIVMNQKH